MPRSEFVSAKKKIVRYKEEKQLNQRPNVKLIKQAWAMQDRT